MTAIPIRDCWIYGVNMEYDPIKNKLAIWLSVVPGMRRMMFSALDMLLLRQRYVKREIRQCFPPQGKAAFYDAGAGFCQYSWYVLSNWGDARVHATDLKLDYLESFALYAKARMGDRFSYRRGDLQNYQPEGEFDMAIAIDILEHIPDDLAVMRNIHAVLKPGGVLIISTPSDTDPAAKYTAEHVRPGYDKAQLEAKLLSTGFRIRKSYYSYGRWGHLAWLLMMKYPLALIQKKLWPLLSLYYLLAYPAAELFMRLDMVELNATGTGIIVVAERNADHE